MSAVMGSFTKKVSNYIKVKKIRISFEAKRTVILLLLTIPCTKIFFTSDWRRIIQVEIVGIVKIMMTFIGINQNGIILSNILKKCI